MNLRKTFQSVAATREYPEYLSSCLMLLVMDCKEKVVVNDIKLISENQHQENSIDSCALSQQVRASQCEGAFGHISSTSKVLSVKVLGSH